MTNPENPFNPATNPDVEYLPYDADPTIRHIIDERSPGGRQLSFFVSNWRDAVIDRAENPYSEAHKQAAEIAQAALDLTLERLGIMRTVQYKSSPDGQ